MIRRDRDLRAGSPLLSALLWCALVAAASGIGRLLEGVGWLVQLALAVGIVLAVPAAARALRAHPVVPPLLATVTAVAVVTAMFVPSRALLFLVPTPSTIGDAQVLAQRGFASITEQGLPAIADEGITFLLVGGVVVLAWAADLFAFSVRLPAFAGLFPAVLLAVPAVIDPADVSWASLVLTAVAYAAVLAVTARPRRPRSGRVAFGAAVPAVAVVGVVVVTAGLLAGSASGYVRTAASSGVSGTLFNGSIDPVVALGADLRRPDPVTVLRYSTDAELPVYLRVLTVSEFDGENWAPSETEETAAIEAPIAPDGLSEAVPRETEEVDVSVETLRSRWLPVPYPVASVTGAGEGWLQDVQDGSIRGDATTRAGDEYDVETLRLEPDPQQLLDAPPATGLERFLALPDDVPEIVAATAAEVTADEGNAYDRARALQAWFRSSEFRYSEDTPVEEGYDGDGVGVLEAFLTVREGYCTHFASAMAVMARQLGIPSRLAIGYQPGSVVPSAGEDLTSYQVLSSDLHAWPELFFEGVGWLRFEPTPSRGAPASYSLPSATTSTPSSTTGATASADPEDEAAPSATPTASTATASAAPDAAGAGSTPGTVGAIGWFLLLPLLLVPWLIRALQRGLRRRRAGDGSVEAGWEELLASARDLGMAVDEAATPRVQEAALAPVVEDDQEARGALRSLREGVERSRYSPAAASGAASWEAAALVVAALHARSGAGARALATVLPRSVPSALARVARPRSDL